MSNSKLTTKITEEAILQYADVSKDPNPIHLDQAAALAVGLPKKIAYGMLTMALSTKLITPYLRDGWFVSSHEAKMLLPVFVNETIVIKLDFIEQTNRILIFKITGTNALHKKILQGTIKLQKLISL